ncbi:MAG: glycosyltransferase [Lachnospiraceae bacterium]|nr:glycosyltransferase [Lachnospiraceae bacterium]
MTDKEHFEISYYGELTGRYADTMKRTQQLKDSTKGYLTGLADAQAGQFSALYIADHLPDYVLSDLTEHCPLNEGISTGRGIRQDYLEDLILPEVTFKDRSRVFLQIAKEHFIHVFTKDADLSLENTECRKAEEEDFLSVCRRSDINLVIPERHVVEIMSEEVISAMVESCFVMMPYLDIYYQFLPSDALVCYTSGEEALELTQYFLSHKEERLAIAARGKEAVIELLSSMKQAAD